MNKAQKDFIVGLGALAWAFALMGCCFLGLLGNNWAFVPIIVSFVSIAVYQYRRLGRIGE